MVMGLLADRGVLVPPGCEYHVIACAPRLTPVDSGFAGYCAARDKARRRLYERQHGKTALMAEVLFIKTSSLGDVVHHMPAITDARRYRPDARLNWVVEEAYAPLAHLHPGIDAVIPVASRR